MRLDSENGLHRIPWTLMTLGGDVDHEGAHRQVPLSHNIAPHAGPWRGFMQTATPDLTYVVVSCVRQA